MITHFGPNLSVSHPASGASRPPSSLPMLAATDVTARLKPSSEAMGLKRAENPKSWKPHPQILRMPVARTIHQPKNILGDLLSIKSVLFFQVNLRCSIDELSQLSSSPVYVNLPKSCSTVNTFGSIFGIWFSAFRTLYLIHLHPLPLSSAKIQSNEKGHQPSP